MIRNHVRSVHRELLHETGGGKELWQWFALAFWLIVSAPLSWLLTSVVAKIFGLKKTDGDHVLPPEVRFLWPLRLILIAG